MAVVLVIIFVLCIVVCSMRRSHSKRIVIKSGSDINMITNPSYDFNKNKENEK